MFCRKQFRYFPECLYTKSDTYTNSVDPDETIVFYFILFFFVCVFSSFFFLFCLFFVAVFFFGEKKKECHASHLWDTLWEPIIAMIVTER